MKKSKILIPAFAVLALSVGASVTGTVAWFTANRTQSFNSSFGVVDSEGALAITLTGNERTGTSVDAKTPTTVTVNGKLTHGSYNALKNKSGSLYVANLNGHEDEKGKLTYEVDSYTDLGNIESNKVGEAGESARPNWQAGTAENEKIWYGVSWSAELSIKNSAIEGDNFLLLDLSKTTATGAGVANNGFRIAIMGSDIAGNNAFVLGKDDIKTHVNGTEKGNTGNFERFKQFGSNYSRVVDGTSKAVITNDAGYIGTFAKGNTGTSTISLTFVAWYEGTDEAVTSGSNMEGIEDIAANLVFYARRSNAD